ncbi:MAG: GNAT family N-acetyltransferase [Bdellovibrionales bacterium]|nr:GNAT family N-acetyltransferase [Bdellovibrionales bacterium]
MTAAEDVKIRKAKDGDEAGIANVHVHAWQQSYRGQIPDGVLNSLPLSFSRRLQGWKTAIAGESQAIVFVAESAKHGIVGFCSTQPARDPAFKGLGEITAIYCLNEYKGKGIGANLFRAGVNALVQQGFVSQYLWVLKDNPTKQFYVHMGGIEQPVEKTIQLGDELKEVAFFFNSPHLPEDKER